MSLFEVLLIAVSLAIDAFAVSVAGGAGGRLHHPRPAIRLAFHLGLFQGLMPVLGWFLGSQAVQLIGGFGRWVAFALLAAVGGKMIVSSFRSADDRGTHASDPSRGWTMVGLSVATSIDALAVGVSLAMVGVRIWQPAVIIGLVTAALSLAGIVIGDRVGSRWGSKMEIVGGVLLVIIGVQILLSHG